MTTGIGLIFLICSRKGGLSNIFETGGHTLYEKWDHGVTTINELGKKVYKRFYSKEKALEYMHKNLSSGRWAVYWDRNQSPNFFYAGVEAI